MRQLLLLAALLVPLPAGAVEIEWVDVGNPRNPPDDGANCSSADCGSVPYAYRISKYEVTNAQYVEFLNAVALADRQGLYSDEMEDDGGITSSGSFGSYTYGLMTGQETNPVVWVSRYDALRFANWLHNGQPTGEQVPATTEDGAYTFSDGSLISGRKAGARVFLPNENEWYKAAYYDASTASYFDYPTGSNTSPLSEPPRGGRNSANFYDGINGYALTSSTIFDEEFNYLSDVGAYARSGSPYGTFDQGGNVWEWNEGGLRGGSWTYEASALTSSDAYGYDAGDEPYIQNSDVGFRVASPVPEPGQVLLVLTGGLVLAVKRRKRRA